MLLQIFDLLKNPLALIAYLLFAVIPLLFSIIIHEMAHAYTAYKFGDETAKSMGRLSFNPLKHLDLLGTILLITIGLGWAKPVLIDIRNIKTPFQRMLVALMGPVSNFLLAFIFACFISAMENCFEFSSENLFIMLFNMVVTINIALAVFNLIPLPPLDGSRIITWLLPDKLKIFYNKIEQYGILIMIILLVTVGFHWIFVIATYLQNHLYNLLEVTI